MRYTIIIEHGSGEFQRLRAGFSRLRRGGGHGIPNFGADERGFGNAHRRHARTRQTDSATERNPRSGSGRVNQLLQPMPHLERACEPLLGSDDGK